MSGKTLGFVLDNTAIKFPYNDAIIFKNYRIDYAGLKKSSDRFAKGLMVMGVEKGDKVSIWVSNCPEWIIAKFGVAKIGGILVPINTRFKTNEVQYILAQSDSKVLIMMNSFLKIDFIDMLLDICPELKEESKGRLRCQKCPELRTIISMGYSSYKAITPFELVLELGDTVSDMKLKQMMAKISPEDVVNIQYTSGTTAFPKGVMLTHNNLSREAFEIGKRLKLTEKDRLLSIMPYFHCGGSVNTILLAVVYGACVVPIEYFGTEEVLRTIEKEKCTINCGLEAMFVMEMNHPNFDAFDLSSVRAGFTTGSFTTVKDIHKKMGIKGIVSIYGLTECSPGVAIGDIIDPLEVRLSNIGKPLPGVEIKIADLETGQCLAQGKIGEIWVRGFNVMKGYYKLTKKTGETLSPEGWLKTGDLGKMDEKGYLTFTGRLKDIIRSGGENISPAEVENFLRQFPKIKDVSVVKGPDATKGEIPVAFVIVKENIDCSDEEIIDFCRGKIANFKIPRRVVFLKEFPMTGSGKIHRAQLEEWLIKPKLT